MKLIVISLLAVGSWASSAAPAKSDAAAGRKIFLAKCSTCHGRDAKGSAVMAHLFRADLAKMNLKGEMTQKMNAEDVAKIIENGQPGTKMPAFKEKLKAQQVTDLAAYIKSLGAPKASKGR